MFGKSSCVFLLAIVCCLVLTEATRDKRQGKCYSQGCCQGQQSGNPQTGSGFYQYSPRCHNGGQHCVGNSGCELCWCYRPNQNNLGNRPSCNRNC